MSNSCPDILIRCYRTPGHSNDTWDEVRQRNRAESTRGETCPKQALLAIINISLSASYPCRWDLVQILPGLVVQ